MICPAFKEKLATVKGSTSGFLKGELFEADCELEKNKQPEVSKLSNKIAKLCPRCGKPGSGPYARWVKNSAGKIYTPYYYFAHKVDGKISWCYIPREQYKKIVDEQSTQLSNTNQYASLDDKEAS